MSFYKEDWNGIEHEQFNYCCKVAEIGSWGGDVDSYQEQCTYDEALADIQPKLEFLKECNYKVVVSTTNQDQPNAHKALKDTGFNCSTPKYLDEAKTKYVRFYWKYL